MSTSAPWLNHQKSLAQVNGRPRSFARRRAVAYTGSARMSRFDCCQNRTSLVSRNSHPLLTTPCSSTSLPVKMVAWADMVTAGTTSRIGTTHPRPARADSRGACGSSPGVSPTALTRTSGGAISNVSDRLDAPLPGARRAARVQDRDNHDPVRFDEVVDDVREAADLGRPDPPPDDPVQLRVLTDAGARGPDLRDEIVT